MSTAGKVLTVLILLTTVVWLVMMSAVTQLNVNWEEKIAAQQKNLDQVTADYEKAKVDAFTTTELARAKQDETERELRVRLTRISAAEARQSFKTESLTRLKAEVADMTATAESAKNDLAIREAEKIQYQDQLTKTRDEIAKSQAQNAELRTELAQLQTDFKRLLAENAAKLGNLTKEGAARPASSVRTPPSS